MSSLKYFVDYSYLEITVYKTFIIKIFGGKWYMVRERTRKFLNTSFIQQHVVEQRVVALNRR